MEIRFIASEIRTGTVANGFGGCPAFLFFPLSLKRGNQVYHLTKSCWTRRFVLQSARVSPHPLSFFAFLSCGLSPSSGVNRRPRDCDIGFKQSTFIASDYKVVHCITAEHCGRYDKWRPALSKISHLIYRIRKEHRTSCYAHA